MAHDGWSYRPAEDGIITDGFCGIGGGSHGVELALGVAPHDAVNHNAVALRMHRANHPNTDHHCDDLRTLDPRRVTRGRHVRLALFAPDCTFHSPARGGKPCDQGIRDLPEIIPDRWLPIARPDVVIVENVPNLVKWGPLDRKKKPIKARQGETFRAWIGKIEAQGYKVDWRTLEAHHYGAPTSRERLFVVARRDGKPIRWPDATHGPGLIPFRTAAECIDFSIPSLSIFASPAEAKLFGKLFGCFPPHRPLCDNTLRRIVHGHLRFVVNNPHPFIVRFNGQSVGQHLDSPLSTVDTNDRFGLATPIMVNVRHTGDGGEARAYPLDGQMPTIPASDREIGLITPTLTQTGYGERKGQRPRYLDIGKPLGVVVGCGQKHGLVEAMFSEYAGAWIADNYTERATGGYNGGRDLDRPLSGVTAHDHHSLVTSSLAYLKGTNLEGYPLDRPLCTVGAQGNHHAEVRALFEEHAPGSSTELAMKLPDGRRLGLVDIGFRMLTPRECARAQGFPDRYLLERDPDGRPTTLKEQMRLVGNAIPPQMVAALVRANLGGPA